MSESSADTISVLAKEFTAAALEFHRKEFGSRGYSLVGKIVPHQVYVVQEPGEEKTALAEPESFYVATFRKHSD